MRDPTLFNQTDILNDKLLAQCTTGCRVECKHERCTHGCLHEKGLFSDFVSIEGQKMSETETLGKEWYNKRGKHTHLSLMREISETHAESDYKYYYRTNEQLFNELLKKVTPYLTIKIVM
jgi:lipid-binding SYLF domain-containing protein